MTQRKTIKDPRSKAEREIEEVILAAPPPIDRDDEHFLAISKPGRLDSATVGRWFRNDPTKADGCARRITEAKR